MAVPLVLAKIFKSFAGLTAAYKEGVDNCIKKQVGLHPHIAVVAPHGGAIEPPTSQIASDIAGQEFSCYRFEGIRKSNNYKALHLTSEYFDERKCLDLIADCDQVVTVHGCKEGGVEVLLGGRDKALAVLIAEALEAEGVPARLDGHDFTGTARTNICNRGKLKAGVQLELTEALRKSPDAVARVVRAVRRVLMKVAGISA
jgi:phage replication-related protein YjqB (UPF0714/DUF867 family)